MILNMLPTWSCVTENQSTSDGAMRDYLASLEKLRQRDDQIFWPGHGGPIKNPQAYVNALIRHRREREEAILACIRAGHSAIPAIAAKVYEGLDPRLTPGAAYSILAHIEDLVSRGLVRAEGALTLDSAFYPA
jgi:glyoxylase-like metal-dependent hydrolase (beta-lactamase superfamily II)